MNNKVFLMAMAMMASSNMYGNPFGYDKPAYYANERRKCFRKGCDNHRVGRTELFCSDECKQKYREENK